jgi:HEAT repeat protein
MNTVYLAFRQSIGRDGPDYSLLDDVSSEDRDSLVKVLVKNLDYHNALALGRLQCSSASSQLAKSLSHSDLFLRLGAARALWDIERSEPALRVLASLTESGASADEFVRIEAIGLLTDVLHPLSFAALEAALFDPEYLVRYNAAMVLSHNRRYRTDRRTIERNLALLDKDRIMRFVQRLRGGGK